jgi:hypothetical protein
LSRPSLQSVAGLFVLIAGLAVVYVMALAPEEAANTEAVVSPQPGAQVVETPPPTLEGVDPAVQRVLYSSGSAEAFRADQLTQLPPEVARVLVFYGATLTVPVPAGAER